MSDTGVMKQKTILKVHSNLKLKILKILTLTFINADKPMLLTCKREKQLLIFRILHIKINVGVSVPYRSTHRSSDYDETFTNCWERARGDFRNKKKIVLAGVSGVALHSDLYEILHT